MKNFSHYFNPDVTNIDIHIKVSLGTAEDTGWEFSDLYENIEMATGEPFNIARERVREEWSITVSIVGEKNNPDVTYYITSTNNETGDRQQTGDNEQSIKDVISWIESNVTESIVDHSWEESGNTYQPAFFQFETQPA